MITASIVGGVVITIRDGLDPGASIQVVESFFLEYELWFDLLKSVILIAIFTLMWRKIRVKIPKYENNKAKAPVVILTVLAFVGLNYALISLLEISTLMQHFPSYEEIVEVLSSGSFLVRILAVGIAGPIVEELVCRGIVLNRLLSWMSKWVAVLVGSALFGLIHFNLLQSLYAFLLGIAFSVLYLRYRNLWLPIIGHIAFNLANVILAEVMEATGAEFRVWLISAPGALLTVICVFLLIKRTTAASLVEESAVEVDSVTAVQPEGLH